MIEVFNGSYLHCDGNFLLDDRTVKRHGIPIKIDARESREPETGQNEVDRQNGDLSYHDPLPLGELQ